MQADRNETYDRSSESGQGQSQDSGSLKSTIASLGDNLLGIVRGEVALAQTEIKEDAAKVGRAGGMIAGGGVLGLTGFMFLTWGLTYLLGKKMPMWLSASLVGSALVAIAGLLGLTAKTQLQQTDFKPDKAIDSLKDDMDAASNVASSVKDDLTPGSA